jgi:putative Mg2+ transporter-C (MgtC) family protein
MELTNIDLVLRLAAALLLGAAIGTERVFAGKTAGMRTYALVAMGAALFVVVSKVAIASFPGALNFDPLRMAAQIVVGIGFLGAGMIILSGNQVVGLTSASGVWVAAGIGMAAGFGFYWLAVIATVFTIATFSLLWFLENKIKKFRGKEEPEEGTHI